MSNWHHAPSHHLSHGDTFFITGATHWKQHFYHSPTARDELRETLMAQAYAHTIWLQAWVLLTNHYHFVARGPGAALKQMIATFHSEAARKLNARDGARGRRVWFQYWDKTLTFEGSWIARIKYTNENAVHHGIVADARKYRWCSAAAFEETAPRKFVEAVSKVKLDSVKVYDPF